MRHVPYDSSKINYPSDWLDRAKSALDEVEATPDEEKSAIINKHRTLWAELKPELAPIMNHKCWYTEAPQTGTDTDVDHFRPKNSVRGVCKPGSGEKHPGYWWRAFDPTNYRYSCIVANRRRRDIETGYVGGKADEFPLWDENNRAWSQADDCDTEQPLLIDPCNPADVALVIFGEDGEAKPRHEESERPRFFAKADRSIKLYHINHTDFVKARIGLRDSIMKHVGDARRYYKRLDSGDANADHAYMRAIEELREACKGTSPFSGFVVEILNPFITEECLAGVFR